MESRYRLDLHWCCPSHKARSLEAAMPWLCLKRASSSEVQEALVVLVSPDSEESTGKSQESTDRDTKQDAENRLNLLVFYGFPAKNWQSLPTTNPIESAFVTIRH